MIAPELSNIHICTQTLLLESMEQRKNILLYSEVLLLQNLCAGLGNKAYSVI
jgi:hypothetical protein